MFFIYNDSGGVLLLGAKKGGAARSPAFKPGLRQLKLPQDFGAVSAKTPRRPL